MDTVRAVIHETPILSERRDSARALGFYPVGTLLYTGREWTEMTWAREGQTHAAVMTIEAHRSRGDSIGFAFRDDLGPELHITSVAAFCDGQSNGQRSDTCADRLARWRAEDGTVVAWDLCHSGDCFVARERQGVVERFVASGLSKVEMLTVAGRTLALASSHPAQQGGSQDVLLVFDVASPNWAPIFQEVVQRTVQEGEVVTNLTSEHRFADDGMHIKVTTITQNVNHIEPLSEDPQDRLLAWPATPKGT